MQESIFASGRDAETLQGSCSVVKVLNLRNTKKKLLSNQIGSKRALILSSKGKRIGFNK